VPRTAKSWGLTLYLAYTVAAILLMVTLFAFVLRLGVSKLEDNLEWLKTLASSQLEAEVEFDKLDIGTLGNTILLRVNKLRVKDAVSRVPVLSADEVEIKINWLKSALNFGVETNSIKLISPFVALTHHLDGHVSLGTLTSTKKKKTKSNFNRWLFKQKRINMQGLELNLYSERFFKNWKIKNADLKIIPANKGRKMHITSSLSDEGFFAAKMQWSGNLAEGSSWDGRAHIHGKRLPAGLFMGLTPNKNFQVNQSFINLDSQIKWQQGKVYAGYGKFDIIETSFTNLLTDEKLHIDTVSGSFIASTKQDVTKTRFNLNLPGYAEADDVALEFYALYTKDSLNLILEDLDLKLVRLFAPLFASDKVLHNLNQMQLAGKINRVQIAVNIGQALSESLNFKLDFSNLGFMRTESLPGISSTDGTLSVMGKNIKATFTSDNLVLDIPKNYFRKPLFLGKVQGSFNLSLLADNQWQLSSDKIIAQTFDANAGMALRMRSVSGQNKPFLELAGNFNAISAKRVSEYLPVKIMQPKLIKWLDQAFSKATVTNGKVRVHGNINQKPFIADDNQNIRLISMDIADGALYYQAGWPELHDINGRLTFAGHIMHSKVDSVSSMGLKLDSAKVLIPDFKATAGPKLKLDIKSVSEFQSLNRFLKNTPLKKTFSGLLSSLDINGQSDLKLKVQLPLKAIEGKIRPEVKGSLSFEQAEINILPLELKLNSLAGKVDFSEDSVQSSTIHGLLGKEKISGRLTTATAFTTDGGSVILKAEGTVNAKELNSWAKFMLPDLKGKTAWQGEFNFNKDKPGQAKISSDLKGLAVFMPNIVNKKQDTELESKFDFSWDKDAKVKADFNIKDIAHGILSKKDNFSWRGGIRIFKGKVQSSKTGILLSGNLPFLNINSWNKWLAGKKTKTKNSKQKILLAGTVNSLKLGDSTYKTVKLNGDITKARLKVNFKTAGFNGQATVPANNAPLQVVLDSYTINTDSGQPTAKTFKLPEKPLNLNIKSVILNNKSIGQFKVNLVPTREGANISDLSLSSNAFKIKGSGKWLKAANQSLLNANLQAASLQSFMRMFGYSGNIANAATAIDLTASWPGDPASFSLARINSKGKLKVGHGEFKDVDAKASGKGLINLLNLDLSALNKNGLDFRNISGNFSIKNAVLNTKNTRLESTAVDIDFVGNTYLLSQQFDLNVTVTPKISSALPLIGIAAAVVPGLIVGGVVSIIDKVTGNKVNKAARKKLKISGHWTAPVVKDLGGTPQKLEKKPPETDLIGIPSNE